MELTDIVTYALLALVFLVAYALTLRMITALFAEEKE